MENLVKAKLLGAIPGATDSEGLGWDQVLVFLISFYMVLMLVDCEHTSKTLVYIVCREGILSIFVSWVPSTTPNTEVVSKNVGGK